MTGLNTETPAGKVGSHGFFKPCPWFGSWWFGFSLAGMIVLAVAIGLLTHAPAAYVFGQMALGGSVYFSLLFLANRPLLNPVQAVVAVFYWWFGVGPAVIATWNCLQGMPEIAWDVQASSMEALWIVAPGLLVYAVAARWTLRACSGTRFYAHFLFPAGGNYRPRVLVIYLLFMGFSMLALWMLQKVGINGMEETSFLGGTKTTIWWVGVIASIGAIGRLVNSALMAELAQRPWRKIPGVVRILILVVIAQTVVIALSGGWKGPLAFLGAYYVCAYLSRYQRLPWLLMAAGGAVFVMVITPFVSYSRDEALSLGAENVQMRKQVSSEILRDPLAFLPTTVASVDPAIFFRGIAPLASELTRRNGFWGGEWQGYTIAWGFEILVPRAFIPDKRDLSIGNFIARTVGVDIGMCDVTDTLVNLAPTIPFEVVGNYGRIAGILSFGLIGVCWSVFCVWMLSPARLSSHPLTPFMVLLTLGLEAPLGHYLAGLRGLVIPLLVCFFVYVIMRGKLSDAAGREAR